MNCEGHRPSPPREALLSADARRSLGADAGRFASRRRALRSRQFTQRAPDERRLGCLRLRVGSYRAILRVIPPELPEAPEGTLDVLLIGPRGDVYK